MRIFIFFEFLHQNDAEILGTRRAPGVVPHPDENLHESALERLSRADLWCILHHFPSPIDL